MMESSHFFWKDWLILIKKNITLLCVFMAGIGYLLAGKQAFSWFAFFSCLVGTFLIVSGSCILNMVIEKENDASMARTANRPIPAGRIKASHALGVGILSSVLGAMLLYWGNNPLTSLLSIVAWALYVFIYTPLKKKTTFFLLVGTIPGAIPPLLGWVAAKNELDWIGFWLFAILVVWQMPHFLALSLMIEKDYQQGGIQLLSLQTSSLFTRLQSALYCFLLLLVSIQFFVMNVAGFAYLVVAMLVGGWMLYHSLQSLFGNSALQSNKRLFLTSLVYLPIWSLALLLDHLWL